MATRLSVSAVEGSTYIVTATFTDQDGDPVTPTSVSWELVDEDGETINTGTPTPGSTVNIVLKGTDLTVGERENAVLYMTVSAVYNSVELGNDLPLVGQVEILVEGLLP